MSLMTTTVEVAGGVIYELEGRLDNDTYEQAENELGALLHQGHKVLALDLSRLVFLSSSGLRVFLSLAKKVRLARGEVVFFGPQGNVLEVLNISGFTRILEIQAECHEGEEALRSVASR